MAPDTVDAAGREGDGPVCPECGRQNIPGAAFCAGCGRSLRDGAEREGVIDVTPVDSQATSTFEPVSSTVTAPDDSPWARPDTSAGDPGLTAALPVPPSYAPEIEPMPVPMSRGPQGVRGFWLGVLAVLLILAVLAVYIYAAWLSDSARSSIDGWLPWM